MSETYDPKMDPSRRSALVSTCAVGAVGAAGVAYPLVSSFQPSERAKAAGAPVEADVAGMEPGAHSAPPFSIASMIHFSSPTICQAIS